MKKILLFMFLFLLIPIRVNAEDLARNSKSAILIEASTGEIIYKNNENEKLAPASMTKMMSLILIMEEIESGNLKWSEKIRISENASSMGGSQIYLETGEEMTVNDLVKGISMASANDAVVALAERISGTEDSFVKRMNNKAIEMNLKNTYFKNSTGLDEEGHYSSAYDMAIIAKELVKHNKILEFSSTYEDYLRQNTNKKFWLVNTNKLIKTYSGMDGLKTGYTESALYCLTATAYRNNMRLIGVLMGEPTSKTRNNEMTELLDYGFNLYEVKTYMKKNKVVGKYVDNRSNRIKTNVLTKDNVNILYKKGDKDRNITHEIEIDKKKLPIKKGDIVGRINIKENNKVISSVPLISSKDIRKANFIEFYIRNLFELINGKYLTNK